MNILPKAIKGRAPRKIDLLIREISVLRKENSALREENAVLLQASADARIDELTGLYNRRWLRQYWHDLSAPGMTLTAIVQIDIDKFKSINDRYGHKIGDHAIIHIASALRRHCATVARTGGDEFVLLIPRGQDFSEVADSVRAEARRPMAVPDGAITTTISVGVCKLPETYGPIDLSSTIERADGAMYAAKRMRGDRVVVA